MLLGFLIYLVVAAIVFAFWEIQIEGKDGWAANLPCWRTQKKWILKLTGGRPLTGYHLCMITFLILMVHFPFLFVEWEIRRELLVLGFWCGLLVVEDFLWFVFNPHYGIKKFRKGQIWWHPRWFLGLPETTWIMLIVAGILIYFGLPATG